MAAIGASFWPSGGTVAAREREGCSAMRFDAAIAHPLGGSVPARDATGFRAGTHTREQDRTAPILESFGKPSRPSSLAGRGRSAQ